jgi:hypothetical protein
VNYKSLYPRLLGASDGVGLRSQIHLVARLRAATSVDTKDSKLLGNKGLCRKLAFYNWFSIPTGGHRPRKRPCAQCPEPNLQVHELRGHVRAPLNTEAPPIWARLPTR